MFSHVTIGSDNPNKAAEFYDAVLGCLGIKQLFSGEGIVAYGDLVGAKTFILKPFDGKAHVPGNGGHVAYLAKTRDEVDAFHKTA
jgi:catechol 2,3-dioxygenase-like lactoylglutathione lyase family enzyme